MAQGLLSRRWLLAWLIVLGYLAAVAHYCRAQSLLNLSAQITRDLTPYAEQAIGNPPGVYPRNDYLDDNQGPMVYLIERGYRDPALLRVMLLCEARRCYDFIYLYDSCFNWDLRTHLVEECTRAWPDDPLVHWAAGRCLLTGGEYERAANELLAAERLGFDPLAAGVRPYYFAGRIETALLMAGRVDGVVARKQEILGVFPANHDFQYEYAELLTQLGRYAESDAAIAEWRQSAGEDFRQHILGLRNAWWSGDLDEFQRRAYLAAEQVEDFTLLDWAGIRLALLKDNFDFAAQLAGGQNETYWRAMAETYSFTGSAAALRAIETEVGEAAQAYAGLESDYGRWDARQQASDRLGIAESNLLRAHMLRGDWDSVAAILDKPRWNGYSSNIGKTYDFAMLTAHVAVDYQFEKPWRWYQNRGQLPWLLYSSVFSAAAEAGGLTSENAREYMLSELAVEHGTYHDYSNGSLDW